MASEDETVEGIAKFIRGQVDIYDGSFATGDGCVLADRIEAAHEREVAGLMTNLDALEKAMERVCSRDELNEIVAIKKEIQDEGK